MKFNDANGNKIKDSGENGIEGWKILLKDDNDNPLAEATTDANGNYSFDSLAAGTYHVYEEQRIDWTKTLPAKAYWEVTFAGAGGWNLEDLDFGNKYTGQTEPPLPVPSMTEWGILAAAILLAAAIPVALRKRVLLT